MQKWREFMGYIEDNLSVGEKVVYRANVSAAVLIITVIFFAFIIWLSSKVSTMMVTLMTILTIIVILRVLIAMFTTEIALTDRRIIGKRGVLQQHSIEMLLKKVESISVKRTLLGLIFGYGTVTIIGSGGTKESFPSIDKPMEFRKRVNDQIAEQTW
jgi:uncharacterized membrane protein YdbT with pleckstrin-like domain